MKVTIETYGCTMNQAESEIIGDMLSERGRRVSHGRGAVSKTGIVILNTCTVKKPTEQRILNRICNLRQMGRRLIVTGCMASANASQVAKAAPEAGIVEAGSITRMRDAVRDAAAGKRVRYTGRAPGDTMSFYPERCGFVVAKIPVSEGCLSCCSFCATRIARGTLRSSDERLILDAIGRSVASGAREIELTAQDTGAYGIDRGTDIAELLGRVTDIEGDFRVRLGMLNPEHLRRLFDPLVEAYSSTKVYRFMHLPVQSGSDRVLRDMGRNHTAEEFEAMVRELRRKVRGISVETDMIAGYPTESGEDFGMSMEMLKRVRPTITNVSRFSARPGTRAAELGPLPDMEVKRRSTAMSELVHGMQRREMAGLVGSVQRVLITGTNGPSFIGRNSAYVQVAVNSAGIRPGDFVDVRIGSSNYGGIAGRKER